MYDIESKEIYLAENVSTNKDSLVLVNRPQDKDIYCTVPMHIIGTCIYPVQLYLIEPKIPRTASAHQREIYRPQTFL